MAVDTFVAGAYTSTYNAVAVGIQKEGFELQKEFRGEEIAESDVFGESLIDFIHRGMRVYLQFEGLAYKAGSITPFWPWGALGLVGVVARLASNVAAAHVLTATAGTPAAASPATLTASKAILAPNNPASLLFNSKLRTVPIRLALLLYDTGAGAYGCFTTT